MAGIVSSRQLEYHNFIEQLFALLHDVLLKIQKKVE